MIIPAIIRCNKCGALISKTDCVCHDGHPKKAPPLVNWIAKVLEENPPIRKKKDDKI